MCRMQAFLDTMKRRGVSFLEMLAMEMKVNAPARLCACMSFIKSGQGDEGLLIIPQIMRSTCG